MSLTRVILSDLHLGTGSHRGVPNPLEDFPHDDRFSELLAYHVDQAGPDTDIELILNGDIFDLLKVKVGGVWPTEITNEIATEKLRQCLEGHPRFVHAIREFLKSPRHRLTYLPGNHDLDLVMPGPQELLLRYIAPGDVSERVHFVTRSDTYYLPEGIQIRHGHQLERIHRVDYDNLTHTRKDGTEVLTLPWGSLWILEVMNPAKEQRSHIDRIQPLGRFLAAALLFDTRFVARFLWRSTTYFIKERIFGIRAWRDRIKNFRRIFREDILSLGGYDEAAARALRQVRGVHTLIVGHSHGPRFRQLETGQLVVNTGTWMKMINMDLRYLGQDSGLTYATIEYDDRGKPITHLKRWYGTFLPSETVMHAD